MSRVLRLVPRLVPSLLLAGCLYTKSMVEERFHVQALDCAGGAVTIDNRSSVPMQVCSFGTTAEFCEASEFIEIGPPLGLHVSLRPDGFEGVVDPVLPTRGAAGGAAAPRGNGVVPSPSGTRIWWVCALASADLAG